MEVKFIGESIFPVNIEFGKIHEYILHELALNKLYKNVTENMIYDAFSQNPIYYLIKNGYVNKDIDIDANRYVINDIVSKFFSYIN